jgi:hypothetical protein
MRDGSEERRRHCQPGEQNLHYLEEPHEVDFCPGGPFRQSHLGRITRTVVPRTSAISISICPP